MKRFSIMFTLLACFSMGFAQYTMDDQIYDYLDAYKDMAMTEMEQYGIPASITLAQAIYASKAGTNDLVTSANNHFGIMGHTKEWTGETYCRNSTDCYRKYATAQDSYRDHSLFLSQRSRYVKLFYFPITDYKSWARGLQEAGYSGNPRYADTLVSIIEKYFLMHYDRKVASKIGDTVALRQMSKPTPERVSDVTASEPAKPVTQMTTTPETKPQSQAQPQTETQPAAPTPTQSQPQFQNETTERISTPSMPATKPQTPPEVKQEPSKPETTAPVTESSKPAAKPTSEIPKPAVVNGGNVFVLNPYEVPFKQAYYPYTNRPVYENNKTKFLIAKAGDTYKKLATALQLTEKNLRLYNDVYDDSEPVEDEVVYLEMKSTKSPVEYHQLSSGDTYRYVAQRYGIQLKLLIKRNSGSLNSYSVGDNICIGCK